MPTFDKPDWINHGGGSILGVDIDPAGERLVTCGADNKIRIWSMRPLRLEAAELDAAVPKQLAVLSEFTSPVNCVRFAPAGRALAAGSDDSDAYVFELREGRGHAVFGSGEAANLENWRLRSRLRGHETNVADVAWAPDSRRLATASLDNRVKIWDASTGHCLRTLEGHNGHVKGVAWDPFDLYLASQGDHEVIVWRLEDGAPAARVVAPFAGAPIVCFALRPAWSPDGQTLALPNGYEAGVHIVPLIRRNTWAPGEFSLVGHRGPVTAVRYNPHLYTAPSARRSRDDDDGGGGGGSAAAADDDGGAAGGVAAAGSTDKSFSLWHPEVTAPLLVGRGFCDRLINDLAWSPDGRLLAVASQDGGLTTVLFEPGELGGRVPDADVQALMAQLYGDPRLRSQKAALTAAPDLLQLEARARADVEREERLNNRLGPGAAAGTAAPAAAAAPPPPSAATAAGGLRPPPAAAPRPPQPSAAPTAAANTQPGRLPGAAAAAAAPPPQAPQAAVTGTQRNGTPAKPGPAGPGGRAGGGAVAAAGPSGRDPDAPPPAKRAVLQPVQVSGGPAPTAAAGAHARPAAAAAGRPAAAAPAAGGGVAFDGPGGAAAPPAAPPTAGAGPHAPVLLVPPEPIRASFSVIIHAQSAGGGEAQVPLELQAINTARDARQRPSGELVWLAGSRRQWSDCVQGYIVALAGSGRLAAASTTGGDLMVYSSAGRRLFPPIRLGLPASFLCVSAGGSTLVALLTDGSLRVWDFAAGESLMETSVAPLLAGDAAQQGLRVSAVRLSSSGSPVVVLSNAYAYVHHRGLRCWMRVADDAFPASAYATSISSAAQGELGRLQSTTAQRRHPHEVLAASNAAAAAARPAAAAAAAGRPTAASASRSEQAVLEHNLAAAAALQSPGEWRLWLTMYVRRLAADEDEARLRDLISEFLGPLRWGAATHHSTGRGAAAAAGGGGSGFAGGSSGSGGSGSGASCWEPPLASSVVGRWQPVILGYDKRRLLREVVLKEVAKNRTYQQLVAEVLDQLKHVEAAAGAQPQPQPQPPVAPRGAASAAGGPAAPGWEAGGGPGAAAPLQAQDPHAHPHHQHQHYQPMVLG
ncbi:hypothetical protein PLESTB_000195200 [Pleodorina starrii]|uniref:Protein HIRA n=1 Tax=Pleodorina starrii TaxID=330485 RepID=A0A9W6EYM1_9CHLO|nr:hypothetical protein PLESTB_000195200 [Pleodorina starrii]